MYVIPDPCASASFFIREGKSDFTLGEYPMDPYYTLVSDTIMYTSPRGCPFTFSCWSDEVHIEPSCNLANQYYIDDDQFFLFADTEEYTHLPRYSDVDGLPLPFYLADPLPDRFEEKISSAFTLKVQGRM